MSGRIIVMGSGEVAPALLATHREGIAAAGAENVTVVDTPFGFQENVEQLTDRLVDFFATSLRVDVEVASLRHLSDSTLRSASSSWRRSGAPDMSSPGRVRRATPSGSGATAEIADALITLSPVAGP